MMHDAPAVTIRGLGNFLGFFVFLERFAYSEASIISTANSFNRLESAPSPDAHRASYFTLVINEIWIRFSCGASGIC